MANGIIDWKRGDLAFFEVRDNGETFTIYKPSLTAIRDLCESHGLNPQRAITAVQNRPGDIHGFVVDAETYRAYEAEIDAKAEKSKPLTHDDIESALSDLLYLRGQAIALADESHGRSAIALNEDAKIAYNTVESVLLRAHLYADDR